MHVLIVVICFFVTLYYKVAFVNISEHELTNSSTSTACINHSSCLVQRLRAPGAFLGHIADA